MEPLSHTKEIFQQLADVDAPMGVKTIIENHDAWVHSDPIRRQITAALRTQLAHAPRPTPSPTASPNNATPSPPSSPASPSASPPPAEPFPTNNLPPPHPPTTLHPSFLNVTLPFLAGELSCTSSASSTPSAKPTTASIRATAPPSESKATSSHNHTVTHQNVAIKKLLAPLLPAAILCIGSNYQKHVEETGATTPEFPVLFMKNVASLQNPGDPIEIPTKLASHAVDWECELAVIIGKRCKNVSKTTRPRLRLRLHLRQRRLRTRLAENNGAAPSGPAAKPSTPSAPSDLPSSPATKSPTPTHSDSAPLLNGQVMQDSNTADMIFDVPTLIAFLSGSTTLLPGTVILTGTPSGVGTGMKPPRYLAPGDSITISIEKIGDLTNPITTEPS